METGKGKANETGNMHNDTKSGGRDIARIVNRYFAITRTIAALIVLTGLAGVYFLIVEDSLKYAFQAVAVELVLTIVHRIIVPIFLWGKKVFYILYNECDPFEFAAVFQYAIKKRVTKRNIRTMKLDIARGLFYQGNFLQAYNMVYEVDANKLNSWYRLIYYNLLINCAVALSYDEKLKEIDAELSRHIGKKQAKLKIARQLIEEYELKKAGNISAYRAELERKMGIAKLEYQRVALHFRLAELDFAASEFVNARAHLEYVIKYGNKLFYVSEAKKLIAEIEKQELTLEAKALLFSLVKENLTNSNL